MNINQVWTQKYKPQTLEEVIMSEKNKEYFLNLKDIPNNLLFVGSTGIGKTTIAKLLADKFTASYIFINASKQGNIDTVRTLIEDFISVASMDGRQKVVILDEADGISKVAQDALRGVMEEYLDCVKFILTANYENKLIHALRSRCTDVTFSCSEKQVLQRIIQILKAENITVPKDQVENVKILQKQFFPDIRKTINEFQKACASGTFTYTKVENGSFAKEIKEDLKAGKNVFEIREKVIENIDKFGNDYHSLMKDLFNLYVADKVPTALILISEYMFRHSSVLDPEINFSALLFNLKAKL